MLDTRQIVSVPIATSQELGVLNPEDFETKTGENGSYIGFPGGVFYNATLAALEATGFEHGREYIESVPIPSPDPFTGEATDDEARAARLRLRLGDY